MKLLGCNSVAWIYGWLGGFICQGYMCILLYVKLIRCNGFPYIYAWLEEGVGGQSAMGVCALCYIWNLFGVMVCRDLCSIGLGVSICHRYMCSVLYIYRSAIRCTKFSVVVFKASMLNWRRGVNLPYVYMHCAIYETYLV